MINGLKNLGTAISRMLNISYPIIGAPMFLVSYEDLVIAVSNAGGLGTFPAMNFRTVAELKIALKTIKSKTNKPIGANIILHKGHNPLWKEQLDAVLDAGVEVVITSLGIPRTIVKDVHKNGAKLFSDITTLSQARLIAKTGADALVAVCQGAGGHAGAISPFSLIPYLKSEIDLPIIAAGSIVNGKQMAASFALGAEAVYIGTRFLASHESGASQAFKDSVLKSAPEDIIYTASISGIPANWISSSIPEEGTFDLSEKKKWKDIFSAGHGVYDIDSIQSVNEIFSNLINTYLEVKKTLP